MSGLTMQVFIRDDVPMLNKWFTMGKVYRINRDQVVDDTGGKWNPTDTIFAVGFIEIQL